MLGVTRTVRGLATVSFGTRRVGRIAPGVGGSRTRVGLPLLGAEGPVA